MRSISRMQLAEASALLGDQLRDFVEVYKHYQFKESQTLKEYLEFITHEPVEWFNSLPAKYKAKNITKPKTALFKLLKHKNITSTLGAAYVKNVHDIVLSAYKKRDVVGTPIESLLESSSVSSRSEIEGPVLHIEGVPLNEDAESIHSVKRVRKPRVELLETVLYQVLSHHKDNPLYETVLTLLKAVSV